MSLYLACSRINVGIQVRKSYPVLILTNSRKRIRASGQGLFKVPDASPLPRTVIPAKAGIQEVFVFRMLWIPAFAGMTDLGGKIASKDFEKAWRVRYRR